MTKPTINCDMGEAFGIYRLGDDAACMPYITHANVACGFHASDPAVMWQTVRDAKAHGVNVGAHPGFPDMAGFGRREMKMSREEVRGNLSIPGWGTSSVLACRRHGI